VFAAAIVLPRRAAVATVCVAFAALVVIGRYQPLPLPFLFWANSIILEFCYGMLIAALYREGVRVVFGVPGVQLYGVMAALRDEQRIRFVTARHEQATGYMADGYARVTGDFGTALVVPGPGLLNASAGLSTAYSASSPVLMISGQIPKGGIGKDIGLLHEVNDQLDCIAPVP